MRTRYSAPVSSIVALAVCISAAAIAQTASAPVSDASFTAQITAHFEEWDADHNGELSKAEIDRLIADPHIAGPSAATVAALKRSLNSKSYTPPVLTKAGIAHLVEVEKPRSTASPNFDQLYKASLSKIATYNRMLFASGTPRLEMLHQGRLGDCFCLAPLGALIHRDPQQVVQMFVPAKDGDVAVHFATGEPVTLHSLTDAEIALSSTSRGDGTWVNMYEKAIGMYTIQSRASLKGKPVPIGTTSNDPNYLDVIGHGGSAGKVITILSGHAIKRFNCAPWHIASDVFVPTKPTDGYTAAAANTPPPPVPVPPVVKAQVLSTEQKEARLANLREMLVSAMKAKRLVCAGTPATGLKPPGISLKHAYAVLNYDATKDLITLWNPHGNTFHPKGEEGLKSGYNTEMGEFSLHLTDALAFLAGIVFETDQPVSSTPPPPVTPAADVKAGIPSPHP